MYWYIAHAENYIKEDKETIKKIKANNKGNPSQEDLQEIKNKEQDIADTKKNLTRYRDNLRKIDIESMRV
jgi:DNA-binding transcriptional regulator GbsR (MarR family)